LGIAGVYRARLSIIAADVIKHASSVVCFTEIIGAHIVVIADHIHMMTPIQCRTRIDRTGMPIITANYSMCACSVSRIANIVRASIAIIAMYGGCRNASSIFRCAFVRKAEVCDQWGAVDGVLWIVAERTITNRSEDAA
jgi:hypothetical protein